MKGLLSLSNSNMGAIPFPLPDYDIWEVEKRNQAGLGYLGADTIDTDALVKGFNDQISAEQAKITSIGAAIETANKGYAWNHFGGLSPDQFANYIAGLQAQANNANNNIAILQGKINAAMTAAQAVTAKKEAAAATAAAMPAAATDTTRKALEEYVRQMSILKMGGFYDFGLGSGRRNVFFAKDTGLSGLDGWWTDLDDKGRTAMVAAVIVAALILSRR